MPTSSSHHCDLEVSGTSPSWRRHLCRLLSCIQAGRLRARWPNGKPCERSTDLQFGKKLSFQSQMTRLIQQVTCTESHSQRSPSVPPVLLEWTRAAKGHVYDAAFPKAPESRTTVPDGPWPAKGDALTSGEHCSGARRLVLKQCTVLYVEGYPKSLECQASRLECV